MGSWTDPATLTNEQIEVELFEVELKLGEALGSEGRIGELEARQWRLGRSKRFVRGASDEIKLSNPRSDDGPRTDLLLKKNKKRRITR
jgi:hypothetical protein